jgi:hypothetical protein
MIVSLTTLTFGIIEGPTRGWSSSIIVAAFAMSGTALAMFVLYERRRQDPLIDLRFFRSIPFASSSVIAVAASASLGGFLFVNTLYLQEVRGLSPLRAGLDTLPLALVTIVASPVSGRIVGHRGPRLPLVASGLCLMTACLMLTGIDEVTPFTWLFGAYVVFGLGFGLVNAPITNAAVSGMPRAQAGVASAIASTSRQIGQTLGVAVIGALVTSHATRPVHANVASLSDAPWWTLGGFGAVVLVLGFLATTSRAYESARRTASELNPEALVDQVSR